MNKEELYQLFELKPKQNAPTILVYSERSGPRLLYTCRFIFEFVLNVRVVYASSEEELLKSPLPKINYSHKKIESCLQILPNGLLEENRVSHSLKPIFSGLGKEAVMFPVEEGNFTFDIFSAVFYCISRYEEWQPFEADKHNRFEANKSIFYEKGLLQIPMVNHWINKLKTEIEKKFENINWPAKKFVHISSIDVDNLYAYKQKGLLRTCGAFAKDVFSLKWENARLRFKTICGFMKDPFDIYGEVAEFCEENHVPLIFFFLQRTNTKFDRTISPNSGAFKEVFKLLDKPNVTIGLHPSYETPNNPEKLKEELGFINKSTGKSIRISRQHFLRFDIKKTPLLLKQSGFIADFSMGFASLPGYRSGTYTPFNYYNFETEQEVDFTLVPFSVMDGVYFIYSQTSASAALEDMISMKKEAQKLDGIFVSVFHERTFYEKMYPGFKEVYFKLHRKDTD